MGLTYLADTNIISEIMRPRPDPLVYSRWQTRFSALAISAVTWHELLTGIQRMPAVKRRQGLLNFVQEIILPHLPILSYDAHAAEWHANERARLVQNGLTPAYADGQIAGIAASQNLTLVTRNTADFAHFAGIQLENWFI
ncbi:MAG: type II toxin-antitoxin system VapC family toxin [Anaerolineales bacterium]|nr:type II toxin-antitoxin system VapC family toxin [Anaerolineales bacterium]